MTYWSFYPHLELHGERAESVAFLLLDFIKDNIKMRKEYIVIIHGKGQGVLKEEAHLVLSKYKEVLDYKIVPENVGMTLVRLRVKK